MLGGACPPVGIATRFILKYIKTPLIKFHKFHNFITHLASMVGYDQVHSYVKILGEVFVL